MAEVMNVDTELETTPESVIKSETGKQPSWMSDDWLVGVMMPSKPATIVIAEPDVDIPDRESPVDDTWSMVRIANEFPPRTWEALFQEAISNLEIIDEVLAERESTDGLSYPLRKNVFRAFEITPLPRVKVVLVGQDPYPQQLPNGEPRAQGLSFSVNPTDAIPSSLKNIYKELENTVPGFRTPNHGDLTAWAKQGVLLLNIALTLQPGVRNSHRCIWKGFMMHALTTVGSKCPNAVYVLLGKEAQSIIPYLSSRAKIITAVHPSGLSANRGFFGSNIFNCINNHLITTKQIPIDWSLPRIDED